MSATQSPARSVAPIPLAAPTKSTRPFATYYYGGAKDSESDWLLIGRAATLRGAIRASVLHLVDGQYAKADIYGQDGTVLARVTLGPKAILITGVFNAQATH